MKRCKTCKYWFDDLSSCEHAKIGVEDSHKKPIEELADSLWVGSNLGAPTTFVGPDFGCIHHEDKE